MGRRVVLWAAAAVAVVLVTVTAIGVGIVRRPFPQYGGEVALEGLDGAVSIVRDARGIPHVYADSARDLFRAQGYATAQDRFFQMDLRRRVGSGRLAELVGEAGVPSDMTMRTLGVRSIAQEELPRLAPTTRQYLGAYAEGVNDYLRRAGGPADLGLEYAVLGARAPVERIEPWTEVDSLTWLKTLAWDLRSSNYAGELTRGRLGALLESPLLSVIYPPYPSAQHAPILGPQAWSPRPEAARAAGAVAGVVQSTEAKAVYERAAQAISAARAWIGGGEGIGSNAVVIGPRRSSTGKPLLANDPHLGVGIPSVWHQAGLHCRTVGPACPFDVSGFTLAGVPGVVIGHNGRIAWGMSNLAADATDFYLEKVTGAAYLREGKLQPLQTSTETIAVRGGGDQVITVRRTGHGPIVSDAVPAAAQVGRKPIVGGVVQQETLAVSLAWTGLLPGTTADALFALDAAANFTEFRAAAKLFTAPAQSLVYADVDGNIGFQAPGLIPVRRASTPGAPPGYLPSPGWDARWDWQGWVPFEDLPWSLNPPEGFLVAANQQVSASATPFLTSEWDYGYRSQRIRDLVEAKATLGPGDLADIQADTYTDVAPALVAALSAIDLSADPFTREAQELLRRWDFTQPADEQPASAAAACYNAVWARLLSATFDDDLPADVRPDGGSRWSAAMELLLQSSANPWWDDKRTAFVVETRDEILTRALVQARLDLTRSLGANVGSWSWGRLHTLTLTHPVLGGENAPAPVRAAFDRGPIPMPGGSSVVNALGWDAAKGYAVTWGPSMRMIIDLGDLDSSSWVNQTGTSGHPYHANYVDQLPAWAAGQRFAWPFSSRAVTAAQVEQLRLVPKA